MMRISSQTWNYEKKLVFIFCHEVNTKYISASLSPFFNDRLSFWHFLLPPNDFFADSWANIDIFAYQLCQLKVYLKSGRSIWNSVAFSLLHLKDIHLWKETIEFSKIKTKLCRKIDLHLLRKTASLPRHNLCSFKAKKEKLEFGCFIKGKRHVFCFQDEIFLSAF